MPVNKANTARLAVSVPRDLEHKIKLQAGLQRRSVSNFIENLIAQYFDNLSEEECEVLWSQHLRSLDDKTRDDFLRFVDPESSAKDRISQSLFAPAS